MSNMSYCRFENTSKDLSDCAEHICDNLDRASKHERSARISLVETCVDILKELGFTVEAPDEKTIEEVIQIEARHGDEEEEE